MSRTVIGIFDSHAAADQVIQDLITAGIARHDVSLLAGDDLTKTSGTGEPAISSAVSGAALGGAAGLVLGLAALAIPGLGPVIAAGPLAAALTSAGIGAAAGGLLGALSHLGVPEQDAGFYAEAVRRGGALVSVHTHADTFDTALQIFSQHGAAEVDERISPERDANSDLLPSQVHPLNRVRVYPREQPPSVPRD